MKPHTISHTLAALAVAATVMPSHAAIRMGQDRFFGRGTRGPYAISRQGVESRTESVRVNGRRLLAGRDYFFDATMGAMSFSDSVRAGDVIEVDYQYDDTRARTAAATAGTFGLLASGSVGLGLNYGFAPDASGTQKLTSLGFNGQALVAGSTLTTSFMMDQAAKDKGVDGQNVAVAMKRDTGSLKYSFGYNQVGKQFSQAQALNLVKGTKALNLDGSLQFARNGLFSFKNVDTATPDAKTGVVKNASLLSGNLALALAPGTQFTALHERQANAQGKESSLQNIDRLQLDQKMGSKAGLSLVNETVTTGKNGASETVKATRLTSNVAGDHGLKLDTAFALTDSSKSGNARDAALRLQQGDGPTKLAMALTDRRADSGDVRTHAFSLDNLQKSGLHLNAALTGERTTAGSREVTSLGVENQSGKSLKWGLGLLSYGGSIKSGTGTKFSLAANPLKGFSLSGARSDDRTNLGDASSTRLAMDVSGIRGMKLSGTYAGDDTGQKNTEASRLNLEANPIGNLKLVASNSVDHNDKGDTEQTKVNVNTTAGKAVTIAAAYTDDTKNKASKETSGVNIEAKPTDALQLAASFNGASDDKGQSQAKRVSAAAGGQAVKVSAAFANATTPTGDSTVTEAGLAITPVKDKLSVSGTYRDESKTTGDVMVATLQAAIKPVDEIAMTGFYKQRDNGTAEQVNTVNAQLALGPAKTFQVVGTYIANPEEKDSILRLVRRGLALKTHMGGLSFTGGYTEEQSLIDTAAGARAEFTLGLRFSKFAELQGGFQQTVGTVRGYKPMLAYNMKYNHAIGQDFHLSLDANVSHTENTPSDQSQEVKATANLGVRF